MATAWLTTGMWGLAGVLGVELVRDSYHVLTHVWPPLYRWHVWHHRVYRQDLTVTSEDLYRQAQWRHDVPEAGVMLLFSLLFWALAWRESLPLGGSGGFLYTLVFWGSAVARGLGFSWAQAWTDLTHLPGPFPEPPSHWWVNRPYHWRHHFDNQNAYYCGTFALLDRLLGTALSLKGKTIAVTGASGTLGLALLSALQQQEAKVIALTSGSDPVTLPSGNASLPVETVTWQVGEEVSLNPLLDRVDILVLNHGINVHGDRTPTAIAQSYEVNVWSSWRLLEQFLATVCSNRDRACKELWVNTSEAEVSPAFSPLYELSKRTLGDLVTLRRLDAPCVVRKLVLGPFKSNLNPVGVMSATWVARLIVALAQRDFRNIIVTINPLTFVLHPLKEGGVNLYYRCFSRRKCSPVSPRG